jgi:uncharacterized protein (DUF1810 family)
MSAMSDTPRIARHCIAQLGDANLADDACHSLLELGPSALPAIQEGFRASGPSRTKEIVDNQPFNIAADPHDLARFVEAQKHDYAQALSEIRRGQKRSHWMWYVFPQFDGLGFSSTSRRYSIKSVAEAEAYLRHPILGPRLLESARATLGVEGRSALEVFGSPDDMKLRSCATLFASISPAGSVFEQILNRYFGGEPDDTTLQLLGRLPADTALRPTRRTWRAAAGERESPGGHNEGE